MKKIIIPALFLIAGMLSHSLSAQNNSNKNILPGSWLGNISVSGSSIRLVFNLKLNERDSLIATADSPDQGAKNIPLGRVIQNMDSITIKAPLLLAEYKGTIINDTTINGTFTQRGGQYTVNLKKLKTIFTLNRPQEPKPKFPYISEDVIFTNNKSNIQLAGTLTIPGGEGPFPAVIMITGSGAQNRDEEIFGHKPFMVIADWLTRQGIVVLRYDDRGVGKSKGSQLNATSGDFATDAQAAFDYLKNNPKINSKAIGLIGHSEGGLIAPIVATSNPKIAFIVSLAGPGVNGERILYRQQADISRLSGVTEDQISESKEINEKLYGILKKEKDNNKAETEILTAYKEILIKKGAPKEDQEKAIVQLKASFGAPTYTWFRYFMLTEPAKFWKQVKCPVLALNGEKDLQVAADENLPAIEKALKSGGNKTVKTIMLADLNHLFQHCKNGLPAEYGEIEETFSPEVLKIISGWILGLK